MRKTLSTVYGVIEIEAVDRGVKFASEALVFPESVRFLSLALVSDMNRRLVLLHKNVRL